MARASVRGHCEKLGFGAVLAEAEIGKLIDALSAGLSVFVGREKATQIRVEVQRALAKVAR